MFVAAEFALVAADRSRLDQEADAGSRRAGMARGLLSHLSFHLAGAQLGITLASLVIGVLAQPAIATLIEPLIEPLVGATATKAVSLGAALALATFAQMILAELVPKGVAIARPEATTRALAPFLRIYGIVFGPFIKLLNGAANRIVRKMGIEPREELSHVRSLPELEVLIATSAAEGTLADSSSTLLARSIRFGRKTAADALVPRVAIEALQLDDSVAQMVERARGVGLSRFPVYGADLDDIRGFVHVKAAHEIAPSKRAETPVSSVMVDIPAVPESRELDDLLIDMRRSHRHLMVVVDEYGGTAGIITLEDLVEEIVGEIDDEYDTAPVMLTSPRVPGEIVLSGALHVDEVGDSTGLVIPEGEYETLAGFMLDRLGHIPLPGERVRLDGWVLEVAAMDRRRISEVVIRPPADIRPGDLTNGRDGGS